MDNQKDELSVALKQMQDNLKQMQDNLKQMQDNLKKVADEHAERIWLQSARNKLDEQLRGGQSLPAVSQNIIDGLAAFCEAQLGAFYVLEEDSYRLYYRCGATGSLPADLRPGEGLVGLAAAGNSSN